ncbi:MAG: non-ribosomal peptide synthetase, partial [Aestuariivirgaceae bacterium]
MSDPFKRTHLPPEQEAIRAKCFHPTGRFVEFKKEEVEQSIPERIEKIVRMYPERIAVKAGDQTCTYAELDAMANGVARTILARQDNRPKCVGLLFEKGAEQIAAMVGVLKAGNIVVLLDPRFPHERVAAILEDSQAGCVISDHANLAVAHETASTEVRVIEFQSSEVDASAEDLRLSIAPDASAAIIYTSGSTGRPKGVVQNHRNMLHSNFLRSNDCHVCPEDRSAALTAGTANSIFDVLFALVNGAALLPFDVRQEGVGRLASWLATERISLCAMSSRLFRAFCQTLTGAETFPDLRLIRLRSETTHKSDVGLYRRYFSTDCILSAGLAATEAGNLRSYFIDHDLPIPGDQLPVGYAFEDKEVMLLDDNARELGFNEVGEIVVRSRYLSPGYWQRPDLTEGKFRPDPSGNGNRLYFTGDLGLMLPDGCLIHKGRKDFRIKIRGYGVEIAEVEKALFAHAAIKEAFVLAQPDESGEDRLLAYIIARSAQSVGVSDLHSFLRQKLPDYMIPSRFIFVSALPLTPGGKLDRKALPKPDERRPELSQSYAAPRNEVERMLAEIWADVLSVDRVGIHDNFFDLGGHSLAATRVVSQVIKQFRLELPLQSLFQSPTVAAMAAVIE